MAKPVRYLVLAWVLLMGWAVWGYLSPGADRRTVGIAELRRELDATPVVPGSVPVGKVSAILKFGLAHVSRKYQVTASFEQISGYYLETLPRRGWIYRGSTGAGTSRATVEFCKGAVAFTVGLVPETNGATAYRVGTTWQGSAHASSFCDESEPSAAGESPYRGG